MLIPKAASNITMRDCTCDARNGTWRSAEELLAVSDRPSQNAPEHVAPAIVAGHAAVRDCKRQSARVIRNDTVSHVNAVDVVFADEAAGRVSHAAELAARAA
jgi:hypothetical protein